MKLGIFKDTGLHANTVEHWLRMVLCARMNIRDEPPLLGESQKPGQWRIRPIDVMMTDCWPLVGGVQVSFVHERWC